MLLSYFQLVETVDSSGNRQLPPYGCHFFHVFCSKAGLSIQAEKGHIRPAVIPPST
jgi:hypothetical protein